MTARFAAVLVTVLLTSAVGQAYLKLGSEIGSQVIPLRWTQFPVRYQVTNRAANGVTAVDLQAAVSRAFATWAAVPGPGISGEFIGFSNLEPFVGDGVSVIAFQSRPDLDMTLGATKFNVDNVTGEILDADIFLNSSFPWSVSGQPSRFDVESIALHEIGHLLGLGHSALGETELMGGSRRRVLAKRAVMFPIAFPSGTTRDRALNADDIAGISDAYLAEDGSQAGSISGRVLLSGRGIFGAHVTVLNTRTGDLVGSFTLDQDGRFVIGGLTPGIYALRAEPIDDADLDSFFEGDSGVEVNFKPSFAPALAVVPAGGTSTRIDIAVIPK